MTPEERDTLEKEAAAVKQEISTLNEAITDIEVLAPLGPGEKLQLQDLRSTLATRSGELQQLEANLA